MFGYLLSVQGEYGKAIACARRAFEKSGSFYSCNMLGWLQVAGVIDIENGTALAQAARLRPDDAEIAGDLSALRAKVSGSH